MERKELSCLTKRVLTRKDKVPKKENIWDDLHLSRKSKDVLYSHSLNTPPMISL